MAKKPTQTKPFEPATLAEAKGHIEIMATTPGVQSGATWAVAYAQICIAEQLARIADKMPPYTVKADE